MSTAPEECEAESTNPCVNKAKALPLKIISIVAILLTSMIGVSAPLFSRYVPFLHPDGNTFTIVKDFAPGIILGTSFIHVLPDSFEMLSSEYLEDDAWHKFPFTGFLAMLSGLVTLAIDSMATSFYSKTGSEIVPAASNGDQERANPMITHGHRLIATVMELH
ncbi:zinc transporter 8 precursor [Raphanus sativus]|nr:zinc transporter 8 precursor [Raphanus sativus]